jgi:hypothetical protein
MSHYSDDYEYEDNKRLTRAKVNRREATAFLRQALDLADVCKPYDKDNFKIKIQEALFWLHGPGDYED